MTAGNLTIAKERLRVKGGCVKIASIEMKKRLFFSVIILVIVVGWVFLLFGGFKPETRRRLLSPLGRRPLPLAKYSFEKLREREYSGSEIKLEKVIKKEKDYTAWLFSYFSDGKKITGMINLPRGSETEKRPVVVMLRGYVDDQVYFTGLGTRRAAGVFAQNGLITLAPDFLGFGGSDWPSEDILEARFNRPVEVLNLLASIKKLPQADPEKVFLWGHSNGGQIALSVLEISQRPIPTTLWAPLTLGFPRSVLTFMGELDDQGRKVKKAIDQWLENYDPKKYSIDNYWQDISAPLQIHQGLSDPLVKPEWTDAFVEEMNQLGKKVKYYRYPGNDHNLKQSWDLVVQRDLEFFRQNL